MYQWTYVGLSHIWTVFQVMASRKESRWIIILPPSDIYIMFEGPLIVAICFWVMLQIPFFVKQSSHFYSPSLSFNVTVALNKESAFTSSAISANL